ncbi:MAG TPA: type I methionyl aminopeptidase [Candidatus Methanoperedens sp.]|nr:type I methionyl aminopeptidase [Candidatus Methanoperedens sp.]
MILIKTPKEIEGIRASCQLAAATLKYTASFIKPGVSTESLNDKAHDYIISHKAIPAPLNYGGFPKSICTSINNVVCHGIPSKSEILKEGDIINIDITTILNGYFGDTSATYPVGEISKETQLLIDRTKESLDLAIRAVKPNKYLNECVGKVIEDHVSRFYYSPVRDLGGHGVGIKFHEDPFVFHYYTPQNHILLKPGMIFTIEPMINASKNWHVYMDSNDGWTIRTKDNSLSAQFEHTILVTDKGSEILTMLP